ncbi:MAG: hypothetical protein HYV07_29660 [Deltaproteobacteria bacterium]|nr:hypothetical protein [Deltaproteobacteria bacterium]
MIEAAPREGSPIVKLVRTASGVWPFGLEPTTLPRGVVLVDVDEVSKSERLREALGASERLRLSSFEELPGPVAEKRRREFLAGRIAAKWALQRVTGLPFKVIEIENVARGPQRGRPIVVIGGTDPGLCVSISHARTLAAAVVARGPIGFDLDVVGPKDAGFERLVLGPRERPIHSIDRDLHLTAVFVMKEAIVKCRTTGLSVAFHDVSPDPELELVSGTTRHRGELFVWALARPRSEGGVR